MDQGELRAARTARGDPRHMITLRRSARSLRCIFVCIACFVGGSTPLELRAAVMRVAIAPFAGPEQAESSATRREPSPLAAFATQVSDRLGAELSRRFQVVPPDKVRAALKEQASVAAGLTALEAAMKAGRSQGADWLVTGSIAVTATRTQLWTRVIDLESKTVTDVSVNTVDPQQPGASVSALAMFVGNAGMLTPKRHFIVLGPFQSATLTADAGQSARRLPAALSRHFREAGFEVVDADAAAPFLAGFRESEEAARRLKLLPGFWLVDAAFGDVAGQPVQVNLHVQRMGGAEENFLLTEGPGPEVERAAVAAIQKAMENARARATTTAAVWQSEMHRQRALSRLDGPPIGPILNGAIDRQAAIETGMKTRAESTIASFEIALAQNPSDLEARFWLGYANVFRADPEQKAKGRKLLQEVAAGNRPDLAERARRALAAAERYSEGPVRTPPVKPGASSGRD